MRSSSKASGFTPWHSLSSEFRDAKRGAPTRTPNKKKRARAPLRAPSESGDACDDVRTPASEDARPSTPSLSLVRAVVVAALGLAAIAALRLPGAAALSARPDPCNRICRYSAKLGDGQICIGCFRTADEMRSWASMDERQARWAELDVAERREAREAIGGHGPPEGPDYGGFPGSDSKISERFPGRRSSAGGRSRAPGR